MILQEPVYLTADKLTVVKEGDLRAAWRLGGVGKPVDDALAASLGLVDGRVPAPAPAKEKPEAAPAPAPAPAPARKEGGADAEDKAVRLPPETKRSGKPAKPSSRAR